MKSKFSILALVTVICPLHVFATPHFAISGLHPNHGSYQGILEVQDNGVVLRVIEYDKPIDNLKVQEVWIGAKTAAGYEFNISMAEFITKADSFTLPLAEATKKTSVILANSGPTKYVSADKQVVQEAIGELISENQKFKTDVQLNLKAVSNSGVPLLVLPLVKIAKNKIGWTHDEFVMKMDQKVGCEDKKAKEFEDFTDRNFFAVNKDTIRVYNQVLNPLSLAEGKFRQAAFALSWNEKVELAEKNMHAHINNLGMNVYSSLNTDGTYSEMADGDSTLWTGEYIAFLAEKYKKVPDELTLEKIKKSANALMLLVELFQNQREFGRTMQDDKISAGTDGDWISIATSNGVIKVLKGGNNDMFKGLIIGLLAARSVIPESDTQFHQRLVVSSKLILNLKLIEKKGDNRTMALGLAAVANNDQQLKNEFLAEATSSKIEDIFDGGFYWNGISDYSGINLGMVDIYSKYLIAQQMQSPEIMQKAFEKIKKFRNEFRSLNHGLVNLTAKKINPSSISNTEKIMIKQKLATIPYPCPKISVVYDHSARKEFCLNPVPSPFWKAYSGTTYPIPYYYKSLTTFPLYQSAGINSNYVWKDAYFEFKGESNAKIESSPVDILFTDLLFQ